MRINLSPTPTCQNYLINDFDIKNTLIPKNIHPYHFDEKSQMITGEKAGKLLQSSENYTTIIDPLDGERVHLDFLFDKKSDHLVENVKFNVADFSTNSVSVSYLAERKFFHNGLLDFNIGKDCHVSVVILSDVTTIDSLDLLSIKSTVGERSTLSLCIVDLSRGVTMSKRLDIDTLCADSTVNVHTICLAENGSVDYNYIAHALGERDNIDIGCVAALSHTDKRFKACIDFKKGSRKSVGKEKEVCLLLDDDSRSLSLPTILCAEEDVDISHASSTAKLSDKALFYMNSRGIGDKEANRIYLESVLSSFMGDLDNKVKEKILDKAGKMIYEN